MRDRRHRFVVLVVALAAVLAVVGTATAQPAPKGPSAVDKHKIDNFTHALQQAGFALQEGTFKFADLIQEVCEGRLSDTLANNPWPNAYTVVALPPHQGVTPLPSDLFFQIGPNEAVILVGQTPPPAAFFSYQTFLINAPGDPRRLGVAIGDSVNIGTIRTIGPTPFDRTIVYILTGHRGTEHLVWEAARKAGYPDAIINVEGMSPVIAPMVVGDQGSWFALGHRVAVAEDPDALQRYERYPPYRVFRVSPNDLLARRLGNDPEPVPILRPRGTGRTEMELYPALKRLRQAILDRYGEGQELDSKIWSIVTKDPATGQDRELITEKPYVGLQRYIQAIGTTRDTNYIATYPNFRLREGVDEFVIAYGVNHEKTGKATYGSISVYADKYRWFGPENGTMTSPHFGDSARHYLPDDPDADYLYAIRVARNCGGDDHCLQVGPPTFKDIYGNPYKINPTCTLPDIDNPAADPKPWDLDDQEMFFLFRGYMEPKTKVAPDDKELLYDRAIYFKR